MVSVSTLPPPILMQKTTLFKLIMARNDAPVKIKSQEPAVRVTANEGGHQLASAHVRAVIHQTWPRGDGYQHGKVAGEQWDSTVAPTYTSNTVKKDRERGPPADATNQSASQSWASNSIRHF